MVFSYFQASQGIQNYRNDIIMTKLHVVCWTVSGYVPLKKHSKNNSCIYLIIHIDISYFKTHGLSRTFIKPLI